MLLYLPYIHTREFQGEEGRRVIIAQEMLSSGNWVVPHVEGRVYMNKPPFYNWMLAVMFRITGTVSEATARIPSSIVAFLGALGLSLFWKKVAHIKGLWFILPGIIFLTFTDVIDKAIRAEIDMTFTFFITMSLLSWFYYHELKEKPLKAWLISSAFVGVSVLTKGVQAPAFFYCGIIPFLVSREKTREIFSLYHLAGIGIGLAVILLWLVPMALETGLSRVLGTWTKEVMMRGEAVKAGGFLRHFAEFPIVYLAAYMPWLPFVALWKQGPLEQKNSLLRDLALFCLLCLLFSIPFYWLIPGARLRYILPLSGMLSLFITIPLYSAVITSGSNIRWAAWYGKGLGIVSVLGALSVPFWSSRFGTAWNFSTLLFLGGTFGMGILLLAGKSDLGKQVIITALLIMFVKGAWASVYFPYHAEKLSPYRTAAREINALATPGAALYDFGVVNPHLTYYLGRPVTSVDSLNPETMREGSFVITFKTADEKAIPCGLVSVGEIQARKKRLLLLKTVPHTPCQKAEINFSPLQEPEQEQLP